MLNFADTKQIALGKEGLPINVTGNEEYMVVDVQYSTREVRPALMNKATRALVGLDNDSLFHASKTVLEGMTRHPKSTFQAGAKVYEFASENAGNGQYTVA
ncbi:hypothetical protein [Vibrio sp. D431a]|uniref:hypothetical protein n=1 Tax=Vibrio sp. D431a TaxID=2837388 RepID=UPI002554FC63|nr:hypothetical protein [Vibrio sp. D431a]MDK9789946.1 hypothetical protein [Vibrio sp. D431a]